MNTDHPLFQLRKELSVPLSIADTVSHTTDSSSTNGEGFQSVNVSLDTPHEDQQAFNNIKILTENEKYVVKRLAPDLSLLPISSTCSQGYVDAHSGKALVNDNNYLYIWDYYSSQRKTNFCRIPLHEENAVLKYAPECLFAWPAAMDDTTQLFVESSLGSSGGVCIIHRKNNQFIYYEDIDSINNLHLQLSHRKAHTLNLKLKDDECVTQALNCEPAGIVIATSLGRVLFVTIRDSSGKPKVQLKQQLIKSQQGFFFHSFNASKEVVSLKKGPIVGRGERLLYVTTAGGNFQTWHLSVSIACFKRLDINLFDQILDSLQDLYPFAHSSLQILDSHPLFPDSSSSHLVLSTINEEKEMYYILSTIVLDEKTGSFTIFSTYRLNTCTSPFVGKRPKLFIPAAVGDQVTDTTTVFVLFSSAVVLTQVSSKLDSSYPLRRKWEDIISFRNDVKLIGSGYNSDSLYVMSLEIGVVEVTVTGELNHNESTMEEIRFVKSHVDQAVYFSGIFSNPIEFNLPKGISLDVKEIEADLRSSGDEIFYSKGKYIPPMMNTVSQHLKLRVDLFRNLLIFVEQNFNYKVSPNEKLKLLQRFEIMKCCLELCDILKHVPELNELWDKNLKIKNRNLTMDVLVINQLCEFPNIFTHFLTQLSDKTIPASTNLKDALTNLLVKCVYEAILEEGEKKLRYELFKLDPLEVGDVLPWFINYDILDAINAIFFDYNFSLSSTSEENKCRLLTLVKTLYYLFNQANLWFRELPQRQDTELYRDIQKLFMKNHLNWNQVLIQLSLEEDALQIAEFYQDLEALVETLESLDRKVSQEIYFHYFDKFGYQFASTLFEYYINQNKLDDLFYRFPEQHDLLVQFFDSSEKYGNVAWIQEILDQNYKAASKTLCNISLGEAGNTRPLEAREIYLNVAKLAALVEQDSISLDQIKVIQNNLDTLDGQKNLLYKLQNSQIGICPRFIGTPFEKIFQLYSSKIEKHQSLPLQQLIETYSMLMGTDSFYCALKLLAFSGDSLGYEVKKFLVATTWRRCILPEDWDLKKDDTKSSLYVVLCRYFKEELFRSDLALPSYSLITDKSLLTPEYLHNIYQPVEDAIRASFTAEIQKAESLGPQFEKRIQSIVGTANESAGKKCIVNYETNTVEFYS
ncbi:related to Nucleoporin NUP133 [Zygosaccharomyces bailii]|nr:related to Nucleoporin NUP133 [Zygosaccharomyces bailii]